VFGNGESYEKERETLFSNGSNKARAHVIISTPQRLVEHLIDRNGTINLKKLRYLVVDEADSMRFVREEWLGMLERAANCKSQHSQSLYLDPPMHNQTADVDYNTGLQKILVSATLSLEADKLHDWNLRSPCLYRASSKKVKEKQTETANGSSVYNLPTSDVGRLTLPEGLSHEIVNLYHISITRLISEDM
jgi:superfamily II DNA/RNA helicase